MEELLDRIWADIDLYGWPDIQERKHEYLELAKMKGLGPNLHWIEFEGEVIVNEDPAQHTVVYSCGNCGKAFGDRVSLYQHYDREHKNHKSL